MISERSLGNRVHSYTFTLMSLFLAVYVCVYIRTCSEGALGALSTDLFSACAASSPPAGL